MSAGALLLLALLIVLIATLAIATADVLGAAIAAVVAHRNAVAASDALVESLRHGDPGDDALGAALAAWRDQSQE